MKTLHTICLAFILVATTICAKADEPTAAKFTRSYTLTSFINTMIKGQVVGFEAALDPSVTFSTMRGQKIVTFSKEDMLDFIKKNKGVVQNCITTTSQVQSNNDICVMKVDMKYDNFTRSNYITMANTGDGWKITNVHSVFK
jgi:hypothetical protein